MGRISKTGVSNYPFKYDDLYNYPNLYDEVSEIDESYINNIKDAITNIQIAIGKDPIPDGYSNIAEYISDVSSGNFVRTDGDTITGDLEFGSFGQSNSSRLFFGRNCNCSIGLDEHSKFNSASSKTDFDVGKKWTPDTSENISNDNGVSPLCIIGNSIFGVTSAGSMSGSSGHKIRVFDDVESKGALISSGTVYSENFTFESLTDIDMLSLDDSIAIENVEVHGSVEADNILEYLGAQFSRSLEDDGPPEVIIPADSGYKILFVMFSAYLPYKADRSENINCNGLKLSLNGQRINNPSLYAPYDPVYPNSLNNVSLMNFMVIPSTEVVQNSPNEFIVNFDPSIENRITLVRDGETTFNEYPTLMHMVTVFGQKSGCYDVIRNDDTALSFTLTENNLGLYSDYEGTNYDVS